LEAAVATHVTALGKSLEEPMTRLIQLAAETPKAAAEVIEQLRGEISNNIERDNSLLEERARIMEELNTLLSSLKQTSAGQRDAIEALVNSSACVLKEVGSHFSEHVGSEVSKLSGIADHVACGATEIASLGEAFGLAVELFNASNEKLIDNLCRIEASMEKSTVRSDEQLAYYVAQAREIIDHSMMSQKEIFDELRQLKVN
jgi:ABC-type transporter Mla subunit MlaD